MQKLSVTPTAPEVPEVAPEVQQPEAVVPSNFKDRTPSNWVIRPEEGNIISAANSVSSELFRGTITEFNSLMRPAGV
jgi:hypothetical protein